VEEVYNLKELRNVKSASHEFAEDADPAKLEGGFS